MYVSYLKNNKEIKIHPLSKSLTKHVLGERESGMELPIIKKKPSTKNGNYESVRSTLIKANYTIHSLKWKNASGN